MLIKLRLKSEWVDPMVFWLACGVKGGRRPAKRTLDDGWQPVRWTSWPMRHADALAMTAMTLSVQNSVADPCSIGLFTTAAHTAASWFPWNRAGRSGSDTARNLSSPPSASKRFHAYTVYRATPNGACYPQRRLSLPAAVALSTSASSPRRSIVQAPRSCRQGSNKVMLRASELAVVMRYGEINNESKERPPEPNPGTSCCRSPVFRPAPAPAGGG